MRFPPSFLDEIRARVAVSEVVGRRVKLRRRGREFVGLSPFNQEKTPSFTVNDAKGFYHCFSSGKHGDVFGFLIETEGLSFPEAVERLAGEAGLAMPAPDPAMAEREKERASLYEVMDKAAAFFEAELAGARGRAARDYLARRGVGEDARRHFRIGYAPASRSALREHLAAAGVGLEAMVEAGLLISGADIPVAYDRFRDRVMFPIPDSRGRIIAFGGRALDPDASAKYLNSPETPLFHKGAALYNFAGARKAAHAAGTVIVAEGYMDVVALHEAGFAHAVAPLGTALTERQLALLWRLAPEPVLCFDGDAAGRRAALRAGELALGFLAPGRTLRFAFLPEGQDPDDLVRQAGPEAMAAVLAAALPLIDVLWGRALELPRQTPEQRAALETVVEQYVAAVADTKVREHYSRALTDRLWRLWRGNRRERPAAGGRGRAPARGAGRWPLQAPVPAGPSPELRASPLSRDRPGGYHAREALILVTLVNHPALAEAHAEEIADLEFTHRDLDSLRQRIIDIAASAAPLDGAVMRAQLRKQGLAPLLERLDRAVALRGDWFARSDAALADAEIGWRHVLGRQHKASDLRRELDAAERALGEDPSESNEIRLARARSDLEAFEGNEVRIEGYGRDPSRVPEGGSFAEWVEANRHRLP